MRQGKASRIGIVPTGRFLPGSAAQEAMMLDLHYQSGAVVVRIRTAPGALSAELLDGLAAALTYIGPGHPVVLTGAHDVFAPDVEPVGVPARAAALERLPLVLDALRAHPLPVVAAVNGDAVGAGYRLAEAADLRIISGGVVHPAPPRGIRYGARAAVAAGLADVHCAPDALIRLAVGHATARTALAG
ncbi:enoyl-CoA hydratase/isomerase family protein [Amycolatopsis thermophila]|uniref:Enoyl-CoA hydratase n=1 Tax=Amycolatopsis thermophila TaxID=206084 RepID=A0ABU0F105_9PSEU|nr:enoyl-CoA hydratase-related protein [Amycolatopsis thermophila]MDQ0381254.1 enoyl-CoA hydratase [Amycolatopsis thermophila]